MKTIKRYWNVLLLTLIILIGCTEEFSMLKFERAQPYSGLVLDQFPEEFEDLQAHRQDGVGPP